VLKKFRNVSHGTVYLKNKASDNWFMGLAGGIDTYNMKDFDDFGDRIGWIGQLTFGKWVSPIWGVRFAIDAGEPVIDWEKDVKMKWVGGHGEIMYNMTDAIMGYKPDRVYTFVPYLGIGYMYGMKDWFEKPNSDNDLFKGQNQSLTLNAGIINNFRVGKM